VTLLEGGSCTDNEDDALFDEIETAFSGSLRSGGDLDVHFVAVDSSECLEAPVKNTPAAMGPSAPGAFPRSARPKVDRIRKR
jgi:hypothetical protein